MTIWNYLYGFPIRSGMTSGQPHPLKHLCLDSGTFTSQSTSTAVSAISQNGKT